MAAQTLAARDRARKQAVRLLREGWKPRDVARALRVTVQSVNLWKRKHRDGGYKAQREKRRGPCSR
jgi:transposase